MLFARKNERREIRRALDLGCQVVRERDFRLVADRALDLSPDGMLVRIHEGIEPGERLLVTFQAPLVAWHRDASPRAADGTPLWFDTEAEVTRVVRGRRQGDRGKAVGLVFSTLSRVERMILRGHLRRIPPPVPRRSQRIDWTATIRSHAR